jgi:kynurenine formamidase
MNVSFARTTLRVASALGILLGLSACGVPSGPADVLTGYRWVDLTHSYDAETIFWPTGEAFQHTQTAWGETAGGYFYSSYDIALSEHSGTHLDAPIHFAAGKPTADQIPLERLAGPAAVIDVSVKANADPDYLVTTADIEADEAANGAIAAGAVVLIRTGWSKRWPNVKDYMGDDRPGRTDDLHFPGLAPEAAELFASRGAHAVGIDTASLDHGPSTEFRTHQILAKAELPGLENLTNLEEVPVRGAFVIALPMKIGGGSGAPCRVVALVR